VFLLLLSLAFSPLLLSCCDGGCVRIQGVLLPKFSSSCSHIPCVKLALKSTDICQLVVQRYCCLTMATDHLKLQSVICLSAIKVLTAYGVFSGKDRHLMAGESLMGRISYNCLMGRKSSPSKFSVKLATSLMGRISSPSNILIKYSPSNLPQVWWGGFHQTAHLPIKIAPSLMKFFLTIKIAPRFPPHQTWGNFYGEDFLPIKLGEILMGRSFPNPYPCSLPGNQQHTVQVSLLASVQQMPSIPVTNSATIVPLAQHDFRSHIYVPNVWVSSWIEILIEPNLEAYTLTQDTNGHLLNQSPLPIMRQSVFKTEYLPLGFEECDVDAISSVIGFLHNLIKHERTLIRKLASYFHKEQAMSEDIDNQDIRLPQSGAVASVYGSIPQSHFTLKLSSIASCYFFLYFFCVEWRCILTWPKQRPRRSQIGPKQKGKKKLAGCCHGQPNLHFPLNKQQANAGCDGTFDGTLTESWPFPAVMAWCPFARGAGGRKLTSTSAKGTECQNDQPGSRKLPPACAWGVVCCDTLLLFWHCTGFSMVVAQNFSDTHVYKSILTRFQFLLPLNKIGKNSPLNPMEIRNMSCEENARGERVEDMPAWSWDTLTRTLTVAGNPKLSAFLSSGSSFNFGTRPRALMFNWGCGDLTYLQLLWHWLVGCCWICKGVASLMGQSWPGGELNGSGNGESCGWGCGFVGGGAWGVFVSIYHLPQGKRRKVRIQLQNHQKPEHSQSLSRLQCAKRSNKGVFVIRVKEGYSPI
ncbi:hypothetical protein VP01_3785g1, partial [Puccinia sorghi]